MFTQPGQGHLARPLWEALGKAATHFNPLAPGSNRSTVLRVYL
jgi:hypothetical protein